MIRSLIAIVTGFILFVLVIWFSNSIVNAIFHFDTKTLEGLSHHIVFISIDAFVALVCGYIIAVIAQRREIIHALILPATLILIGVVAKILKPSSQNPLWIDFLYFFSPLVCAAFGGYIRKRQVKRKLN